MTRHNYYALLCATCLFASVPMESYGQGNGNIVAAPTAAAYADLTNASNKMLVDLRIALPQAKTIVLYDPGVFSIVPYYASATSLVRSAGESICMAEHPPAIRSNIVPSLDFGSAASGLAALIQLTVPSYSVQSQNLALDNSALIGSFATAAKNMGYAVVNPTYLLPAVSQQPLTCQNFRTTNSLADLWRFTTGEASAAKSAADSNKTVRDALDAFQKLKDALEASADKNPPLLARALSVESLANAIENPAEAAVIDMRLDAADIDSTTKSVLWWRKTKFSANIAAHYWIFGVQGTGGQFTIKLVQPGYVNLLRKDVDLNGFAVGSDR